MKLQMLYVIWLLPLLAGTCRKEGKDCHHNVMIRNNSTNSVVYALKFTLGTDPSKCVLQGSVLQPNETILKDSRNCWENELSNGSTFDFYIVDTAHFNNQNQFYTCDSIGIKNAVLKHYVLSLQDLRNNNFVITYPQ